MRKREEKDKLNHISHNTSGFTIVELIVVIVVIAVLASITLVSYRYLQTRAADTATAANVKQYVDALEMYAFEHGRYPDFESCIGKKPAEKDGCGYSQISGCSDLGIPDSSGTEYEWAPGFDAVIKKYIGEQPNDVQSSPYKTLIPLSGQSCAITTVADSPVYQSADGITVYLDGITSYRFTNHTESKNYYITYAINKDGECYLDNSVIQRDVLFKSDMTKCVVYGGDNIEIKNEKFLD